MENKHSGIIHYYNILKGFGFIRREKGKDVFFFFEDFLSGKAEVLIGDQVSFEVEQKPKGPRAFKIEILGSD